MNSRSPFAISEREWEDDEDRESRLEVEAMTRSLFEEPTEDIEREDPWSGPKGFLVGGMAIPIKCELGQQYFNAANLLIVSIQRDEIEDYKLVNPILFLYRHSIELTVKGLVDVWGHDLAALADTFAAAIKNRFGHTVPDWVTARLKEIAAMDPNSTGFRYADGMPADEVHISLDHLQRSMDALNRTLLSLSGALMFQEMQ